MRQRDLFFPDLFDPPAPVIVRGQFALRGADGVMRALSKGPFP